MTSASLVKIYKILLLLLLLKVNLNESARGGGRISRPSPSRHYPSSPSRPSHNYSPSRPSYPSHPAPNYGWAVPKPSHPSYPSYPSYPKPSQPAPSPARPPQPGWGINSQPSHPPIQKTDHKPVASAPAKPPEPGWKPEVIKPSAPFPPPKSGGGNIPSTNSGIHKDTARPSSNSAPPAPGWAVNSPGGIHKDTARPVNSAPDPNWNLPSAPRPGAPPPYGWKAPANNPVGPPVSGQNQWDNNRRVYTNQQNSYYSHHGNAAPNVNVYNTHYPGPQPGVTVINKNYNHYSYAAPQPQYHYPGYYYPPTYYHYSSSETGSGALGFFLGYSLGRLTTPTYSHYSFYDGYRPRYDHYTVHHYYHNPENIPKDPIIQSNTIIGCVGDTTSICPVNTTSLCTNNGALMCVASAISTQPCTDNRQVNCVKSTVPCLNNTAAECKNAEANSTATVSIPCVSTAKVYGDIKYVNNTIVVNNPIVNGTVGSNGTATVNGNNTAATVNGTSSGNATSVANATHPSAEQITTTPGSTTTPENKVRKRRDNPAQMFCVTIVALPAKRQLTEGEKLFSNTKNIVSKFFVRSWGLD